MEALITDRPFLWEYLLDAKKPIVLYGMGDGADRIIDVCEKRDIPINAVFASDGFVRGQTYRGNLVLTYEEARRRYGDMIVLLAFGTHRPEVLENIYRIAEEQELYQPDMDVVFGSPYTKTLFDAHSEGLKNAYDLIEDEFSRKTFIGLLNFKITGDPTFLRDCAVPREGILTDLLGLGANERVVDAGAYDGDTVLELYDAVGGWKMLTAFEPDPRNFRKLEERTAHLRGVQRIQAAIGAVNGWIDFAASGGRQSRAGDGEENVHVYSIDKMMASATYIKMDVEGSEIQALHGAQNVLRHNRPKLNVAAYHHHEDLFELPLYVKSINKKYKIYLRHFSALPTWDTNFYFI